MLEFNNIIKSEKSDDGTGIQPVNDVRKQPHGTSFAKQEAELDNTIFTLLYVDDEVKALKAFKLIFLEENYEILTSASAEKAIEIMENNTVHLVISDQKMPKMSGTELLKNIKARWPETIRILVTAYADVNTVMKAINEGAVYKFIAKPWNIIELRQTVSLAMQLFTLIHENKKLKIQTIQQEQKLTDYSSIFNEYRGMMGNILVQTGTITGSQLDMVLREKRSDEFINDTIMRLGFATEAIIVNVIQNFLKLDYIDLKDVDIDTSIARFFTREFCRNNRLVPIKLDGRNLTVAMADPSDITKIENMSILTDSNVIPVIATSSGIKEQIENIYGGKKVKVEVEAGEIETRIDYMPMGKIDVILDEKEEVDIKELTSLSDSPPVVEIVNATILEALRFNASDIHIEPKAKNTIIRFRIDGMLVTKNKIPAKVHAATISRIKVLAKMDISERRKPQDGRINIRAGDRIVDLRISIMPTISGEKAVIRILDKSSSAKRLSELGMLNIELQKLNIIIKKPQGIIISTGPTGSGKSTFLYSILYEMLKPTKNFETIEDPVEYFLDDASQVSINEKIGLTFGDVLRATLRQDPDVILVGEIRDAETADVAFKAALTGHMVLTTLHTNNSIASITRLIDIGVKPYLIASAVESIIAQRLVRKVCKFCRTTTVPDKKVLKLLKIPEGTITETVIGKGCRRCDNTGYHGRTGIFELFVMNDNIRHHISTNYKESEIVKLAKLGGMKTLMEIGIKKVMLGETTFDELVRVIGPPILLERECEKCGNLFDIDFLFCPNCGLLRSDICRNCKMTLEKEWKVCPSCGKVSPHFSATDTNLP